MLILRYLYTFWVAFVFISLMLLAVPFFAFSSFFSKKTAVKICIGYNRWWMNVWGFLTACKLRVANPEKIDHNRAYVFVFNHVSASDAISANACIPLPFTPMAKKEVLKIPILGWLFGRISIIVDRSNPESRKKGLEEMKDNARNGISILVFPEGTRNKSLSEPLGPFKAGAFITAIDAQLPIAPFVVVGGRDLLPNEKLPAQRCNMTAYYADPIETKGLTLDDVEMLKNKTYAIMQQLLIEHDPRFKNYVPPQG